MHATGSSALWGAKVGFFVSSFSAIQIFLDRKRMALVKSLEGGQSDSAMLASAMSHEYSELLPTAGAGCAVGGMFGLRGGKNRLQRVRRPFT